MTAADSATVPTLTHEKRQKPQEDPYVQCLKKLGRSYVQWYYDKGTKETIVEETDRGKVEKILSPDELKLLVFRVREQVDSKLWDSVEFKLVFAEVEFLFDSMDFSMKHVVVDKWKASVEKLLTPEELAIVRFEPMPKPPVIQGRYGGWTHLKTGKIFAKIQYEIV